MLKYLLDLIPKTFIVLCLLFLSATAFAQMSSVEKLLAQLSKNNPDTVQIDLMRKLSFAYTSVDISKKLYYANQYKALAEKNGMDSVVAAAYLDMGICYGVKSKLDSALYFFRLGFEKSKAANYPMGIGRSYANIGYAYDKLERKQDAVKNYEASLKIFRKINFKRGINQNIINLGSLYFDLGEYKMADEYFRQVLENVKTQPSDKIGLGNALYSLGNSNRELGNLKRSLEYFEQSLALRQEIGDVNGIALGNRGIALLFMKKGDFAKAIPHLEIAIKNNQILKNVENESKAHATMAKAQLGLKNYQAAEQSANLALAKAKESNLKAPMTDALAMMVEVKAAQQNFAEALRLQSEYIAVKNSMDLANEKTGVIASDIERVTTDNKKLEINNKLITETNSNYVIVISIITGSLVLSGIFLAIYYNRNARRRKTNTLLRKQKQEIANSNEELIVQMNIVAAQNLELEKLNKVKNKFFSIVSHDLRGPLITLKTLLEWYRIGDLSETELKELLTKVERTTENTVSFLDSLLEWSKSQLEGMVVSPTGFTIITIIEDNIKLMESQIELKDLRVTIDIDPEVEVFADYNMINIVFRNLLSNAIKFCKSGDEIAFNAVSINNQILCSISDTGQGMSEAEQDDLFNFSHNMSSGTAGEKGFHIGLILCKDMILKNSGSITVESKLGEGTKFTVCLPKTE